MSSFVYHCLFLFRSLSVSYNHVVQLFYGDGNHTEHQVTPYFPVSFDSDMPCAIVVFQIRVSPFHCGTLTVSACSAGANGMYSPLRLLQSMIGTCPCWREKSLISLEVFFPDLSSGAPNRTSVMYPSHSDLVGLLPKAAKTPSFSQLFRQFLLLLTSWLGCPEYKTHSLSAFSSPPI